MICIESKLINRFLYWYKALLLPEYTYKHFPIWLIKKRFRRLIKRILKSVGLSRNEIFIMIAVINAELPIIKRKLEEDIESFLEDPSVNNDKEIINLYPGFYAILLYRIANCLSKLDVPIIPRAISEIAHFKTGVDIHPSAELGKGIFIDHGTGVVIGETAKIGDFVRIYQGVTLGAISLKRGASLKGVKRHPTIKNNVTLYANSTVLGGNTVIGNNVTIGCNIVVIESIPDNSIVFKQYDDYDVKKKEGN